MSELKPIGFIIEQKNIFLLGKRKEFAKWIRFSSKIYTTKKIAEQAYMQCPYRGGESGYNIEGRIIPVYKDENELPILIKNLKS